MIMEQKNMVVLHIKRPCFLLVVNCIMALLMFLRGIYKIRYLFRESLRKIIVLTYWLVRKSLQQLQRIALKLFLDMWQNEESKWFNRPL